MPPKSSTLSSVSTALLWWMRMRVNGRSVAAPLALGAVDVNPLGADPLEDVPRHLRGLRVIDLQAPRPGRTGRAEGRCGRTCSAARGRRRDGPSAAARPIGRAVGQLDAAGVRVGEDAVPHHDLVDGVLRAHGLQADALVDVLEDAVAHFDIRAAAQQPDAAGLTSTLSCETQ